MKTFRTMLLSCAGAMALASFLGTPAADADNQRDIVQELDEDGTDAEAIERRLVKVTTILAKADKRLDKIETASVDNPDFIQPCVLPPLATIQTQGEALLASVEALDDGTDAEALARRLGRAAGTIEGASARLDALRDGWGNPPDGDLPPDGEGNPPEPDHPDACAAAIVADLEVLTDGAEAVASRAGELDTCSKNASLLRRLGNVSASLAGTNARLDGIAIGWSSPPDGDVPDDSGGVDDPNIRPALDAELDAIIAEASAVLATAQALRAGPTPHMVPPPTGEVPAP